MRFITGSAALRSGLNIVKRAIPARHSLDQLRHVRIEASHANGVMLSATNTEIAITTRIEAVPSEAGVITVPYSRLAGIASATTSSEIEVYTDEQSETLLHIRAGRRRSEIIGMRADTYPHLPSISDNVMPFVYNEPEFKNALLHVESSTAESDSRPVLQNVNCLFSADALVMAAADGFRLSIFRLPGQNTETFEVNIPAGAIRAVAGIMGEEDKIEIRFNDDYACAEFRTSAAVIVAQLSNSKFPEYAELIPAEYKTCFKVQVSHLLDEVQASSVFADNSIIRLFLSETTGASNGQIRVHTQSADAGAHAGTIACELTGVTTNRIAFNIRYLKDALTIAKMVPNSEVLFEMTDDGSPCLMRVIGHDNFTHVLMPMFVQWAD